MTLHSKCLALNLETGQQFTKPLAPSQVVPAADCVPEVCRGHVLHLSVVRFGLP